MRERLKAIAAENNRSLNAEIVARLEMTLQERPVDDLDQRLDEALQRFARAIGLKPNSEK